MTFFSNRDDLAKLWETPGAAIFRKLYVYDKVDFELGLLEVM